MGGISLFGTKEEARRLKNILNGSKNNFTNVKCFVDNDKEIQGTVVEGIPVVSVFTLKKMIDEHEVTAVIIAVRASKTILAIINQLKEIDLCCRVGIANISTVAYGNELEEDDEFFKYVIWLDDIVQKMIYVIFLRRKLYLTI